MSKTWEATSIQMGKMVLRETQVTEGDTTEDGIEIRQYYEFKDSNGNVLDDISNRQVRESRQLSDVPQDVTDALSTIQSYMKTKAQNKEGL